MVSSCCVFNCSNRFKAGTGQSELKHSFYRFPKERSKFSKDRQNILKKQRLAWFAALKRENVALSQLDVLRICSDHFISGKPARYDDTTNPDWVPSLKMGYERSDTSTKTKSDRHRRITERNLMKSFVEANISNVQCDLHPEEPECVIEIETSVATQTDVNMKYLQAVDADLLQRMKEIHELREIVAETTLSEKSFVGNDKKVTYFTGLPSLEMVKHIQYQLDPDLSGIKVRHLDNFQKLILTMMKLRFNMPFLGLSYRFRISNIEASDCFKKVVILLEHVFQEFIFWPDRDSLKRAMPLSFKKHFGDKVAVIIDCFKIPVQRPGNNVARALTWSAYKHNHIVKYLLGITPHGFVSFISQDWGGRASDKVITQRSRILENLLPGDILMSDRGFTIKDDINMCYAELFCPDFVQKKKQLSPEAVERMRKIASVRIHVKRVISVLKNKFKILKGPVPINLMKSKHNDRPLIDIIVRAACILTNFCDSIVPLGEPYCKNVNVQVSLDDHLFADDFNII